MQCSEIWKVSTVRPSILDYRFLLGERIDPSTRNMPCNSMRQSDNRCWFHTKLGMWLTEEIAGCWKGFEKHRPRFQWARVWGLGQVYVFATVRVVQLCLVLLLELLLELLLLLLLVVLNSRRKLRRLRKPRRLDNYQNRPPSQHSHYWPKMNLHSRSCYLNHHFRYWWKKKNPRWRSYRCSSQQWHRSRSHCLSHYQEEKQLDRILYFDYIRTKIN